MAEKMFRLVGRVVDRSTRRPLFGLRVEAWDLDTKFHDMLGIATTDAQGGFEITCSDSFFGDAAPDRLPDVFFRVFRSSAMIASTEKSPRRNLAEGATEFTIEVEAPQPRPKGKERVKASQVLNGVSFFRKSEFGAVAGEAKDRTSAVGGVFGDIVSKSLRGFATTPIKPIQAPESRTSEIIGQSPEAASRNLEKQGVTVSQVKPYNPKPSDVSPRAVAGMLRRPPRGSQVVLYEQEGRVKSFSLEKESRTDKKPGSGGNELGGIKTEIGELGVKVSGLEGLQSEVEKIKNAPAEGDTPLAKAIAKVDERDAVIAELSTEIERVRAESAQKDAQIENLGRGLTDLERRHDEFTEKVPLERVAKIEADLQKVLRRRGGGG